MEFIDLSNKDSVKLIDDIVLYPLKINRDSSGVLVETLRKDWPEIYGPDREFSMQYYSITPQGVARDKDVWHYHPHQEDRFLVAKGEIITAVAKDNLLNLFRMRADKDPYILLIPKQTLHGFMVVSKEEAILLNYPTALYSPNEEGRIPHDKANVKFPDGSFFTWQKVRQELSKNG